MKTVIQPNRNWPNYNPHEFEQKWQEMWDGTGIYESHETGDKPKFYCLDFFPYPSGEGLHVGHCRNYVPTDVISRYKHMRGYNVLHPMGWDAFGEPAEQYAFIHGIHPQITTNQNTLNYRRQMRMIGTSYDWSREINSSDLKYYRWTQWFFLLMYKRGLAYRDTNWQWWCPTCQTTLSSHEAQGGVCWRGHDGVTKREIPAWYFKITAYADELISSLDEVDWPESIKLMQRNWIGRSEGCEITFKNDKGAEIVAFTTRPDTLWGATFFLIAPEHPLVESMTAPEQSAQVATFLASVIRMSEIERTTELRDKRGVFTGSYVINPINNEAIPVWIADYVLPSYGSGAVMGVPAHDQRDYVFAMRYGLPVRQVIVPEEGGTTIPTGSYTGNGVMINSGWMNGKPNEEASSMIIEHLLANGLGRPKVQYKMRDWLISRQRYWGTPIPIVYCRTCGEVPVPDTNLPILLPETEDFRPDGSGKSPLARISDFVETCCPRCGGSARRESDTMGGFACSSWYFLRFTSPHYDQGPFDEAAMRYWMPVDLYVGGAEHAVLHLLYARFWTKVLADAGLVPFREPFAVLKNQGQLMGLDGHRMSKSRGNVITPDDIVSAYGADTLRIHEMFMAPFEQDVNWSDEGIMGARRFLNRLWNLVGDTFERSASFTNENPEIVKKLHKTIRVVTERIEDFRLNTMISELMEFINFLYERYHSNTWKSASYHYALERIMILVAPSAPYITEELWKLTGHSGSIHEESWPHWDADLASDELVEIAIQVDGKVRGLMEITINAGQVEVQEAALAHPKIQTYLEGRGVSKVIYIPGRVFNIVTHHVD